MLLLFLLVLILIGCMLEQESFHFKMLTAFYVEGNLGEIFGTVFVQGHCANIERLPHTFLFQLYLKFHVGVKY